MAGRVVNFSGGALAADRERIRAAQPERQDTTMDIASPRHFRKRPVVIAAVQFTGDNHCDLIDFVGAPVVGNEIGAPTLLITTLEGAMSASPGDWIIRGVKGEFYPCKPDIFESTYEPVA